MSTAQPDPAKVAAERICAWIGDSTHGSTLVASGPVAAIIAAAYAPQTEALGKAVGLLGEVESALLSIPRRMRKPKLGELLHRLSAFLEVQRDG